MTEVGDIIERIRRFFRDRPDISRSQFARRAGLHRNTLYNMQDKGWKPEAETLEKYLRAIKEIEAEEAKAQRKTRPSKLAPAFA